MKPTRVGPKFQVVIPAEVRRQAGLAPGDLVLAEIAPDGAIVLRKKILADPATHPRVDLSAGSGKKAVHNPPFPRHTGRSRVEAVRQEQTPTLARNALAILKQYSAGKPPYDEAAKRLSVDYGTLLVMLSNAGLSWPRLPKAQRERMVKEFVELLRGGDPG